MDNPIIEESEKEINIQEIIKPYLRNWIWFIIVPIICLIATYFYLKFVNLYIKFNLLSLLKMQKRHLLLEVSLVFYKTYLVLEEWGQTVLIMK
jgi:hypothetical protein